MPSLKAVPHLSHLMSLANPYIDEYPYCTEGPCNLGDKAGVSAADGATGLVATCWLTPLMGSL